MTAPRQMTASIAPGPREPPWPPSGSSKAPDTQTTVRSLLENAAAVELRQGAGEEERRSLSVEPAARDRDPQPCAICKSPSMPLLADGSMPGRRWVDAAAVSAAAGWPGTSPAACQARSSSFRDRRSI